eukprot:gene23862-43345_t
MAVAVCCVAAALALRFAQQKGLGPPVEGDDAAAAGGTLRLDARDSGLTLAAYPGEAPEVSGGAPLSPQWRPHDTTAGRNIWVADLSAAGLADVPGLRLNGERVVRARHPNADPERQGLHTTPTGWVPAAESWLPGVAAGPPATPPIEVLVREPNRSASYAVYPYYTVGIGGLCNGLFEPNVSFWCNPRNPRDGTNGIWNGSGGLVYPVDALPAGGWTNATRAVAHVWHCGGHWASQMYDIAERDAPARTLRFGRGGFQDARASALCSAEWYGGARNVYEFLDAPNEYYYSSEQRALYVCSAGRCRSAGDGRLNRRVRSLPFLQRELQLLEEEQSKSIDMWKAELGMDSADFMRKRQQPMTYATEEERRFKTTRAIRKKIRFIHYHLERQREGKTLSPLEARLAELEQEEAEAQASRPEGAPPTSPFDASSATTGTPVDSGLVAAPPDGEAQDQIASLQAQIDAQRRELEEKQRHIETLQRHAVPGRPQTRGRG